MRTKNTLVLVFLLLSALVLSALIGALTQNIGYLKWLTWGDSSDLIPSTLICR